MGLRCWARDRITHPVPEMAASIDAGAANQLMKRPSKFRGRETCSEIPLLRARRGPSHGIAVPK